MTEQDMNSGLDTVVWINPDDTPDDQWQEGQVMLPTRGEPHEFRFAVNAIRGDMIESDFMAIDQINKGHSEKCNFIPEAAEPEPAPCETNFDPT